MPGLLLVAIPLLFHPTFPARALPWTILFGALVLYGAARSTRGLPETPDLGPGPSRSFLALILLAAVTLRLTPLPNGLPGFYANDCATILMDARNSAELGVHHLLFPYGFRPPFHNYWLAGWLALFPQADGFLLQRIAAGVLDSLAVLLGYFLGREIHSRRFGLLFAALAAVSMPQIRESLYGCYEVAAPFATTLALLATFRIFRDPRPLSFLAWGASLALLFYTYIACYPLALFLALAVLVWILRDPGERGKSPGDLLFPLGSALTLTLLFLWKLHVFKPGSLPASLLSDTRVQGAILLFLGSSLLHRTMKIRKGAPGTGLLSWTVGILLTLFLITPLTLHPDFGRLVDRQMAVGRAPDEGLPGILWNGLWNLLEKAFIGNGDRGAPILSPLAAALGVAGLAVLAARPSSRTLLLFLALGACVFPWIVAINPHHSRAMAAVIPFTGIAALALLHGRRLLMSWPGRDKGSRLGTILLLLFLAWEAWGIQAHLRLDWASQENATLLCAKAIREVPSGSRIFLETLTGDIASPEAVGALADDRLFYFASGDQVLHLFPEEKVPDVEVLLSGDNRWSRGLLAAQFPEAEWVPLVRSPLSAGRPPLRIRGSAEWIPSPPPHGDDAGEPLVWKILIPGASLREDDGRAFRIERSRKEDWRLRLYWAKDGLGHGAVWLEDTITDLSSHPPLPHGSILHLERRLDIRESGTYRFTLRNVRSAEGRLDGRRFLRSRPGTGAATGSIELPAGPHVLTFILDRGPEGAFPVFNLEGPDLPL